MATGVNCGVDDAQNKVAYYRGSATFKNLKERNFSFTIEETTEGMSEAIFRITDDSSVVLCKDVSKPFPTGAIRKKSTKLKEKNFVVKLEKKPGIKLDDYFG